MGSTEMEKPTKDTTEAEEPKNPNSQEQASSTGDATITPDCSGFQAYSPMPPHGYMASSPHAPHLYIWGVQHVRPPYGTPPYPYVAIYPHGGIYAHPSMPPGPYPCSPFAMPSTNGFIEASGNTRVGMAVDNKESEGNRKLPIKRSRGSLGSLNMITDKRKEAAKTLEAFANGGYCKSADSRSEGSSTEGSDANSRNDSQLKSGSGQDSMEAEASHNGNAHGSRNGNIGMELDCGGGAISTSIPVMHRKVPCTPAAGGMVDNGSRESMQSQLWVQDERELKRWKRKQSNTESARRSRLPKQAECDELALRAEALIEENTSLRAELNRILRKKEEMNAENLSLKEKLGQFSGTEGLHLDNEVQEN